MNDECFSLKFLTESKGLAVAIIRPLEMIAPVGLSNDHLRKDNATRSATYINVFALNREYIQSESFVHLQQTNVILW